MKLHISLTMNNEIMHKTREFQLCVFQHYYFFVDSYKEKHAIQLFGRGHIGGIDIKVGPK